MGASNHPTSIPVNADDKVDRTYNCYVVVGVGNWPEDGFEIVRAFDYEGQAEDYIEDGRVHDDADRDWSHYYVTEVDHA